MKAKHAIAVLAVCLGGAFPGAALAPEAPCKYSEPTVTDYSHHSKKKCLNKLSKQWRCDDSKH